MTQLNVPVINASQAQLAFQAGADCVYTGLSGLTVDFNAPQIKDLDVIKKNFGKKAECVIDRYFHIGDFDELKKKIEGTEGAFDRFTISDLGLIPLIKEIYPGAEICISDYANCTNSTAAEAYSKMGCSRVILGQESTIADIKEVSSKCSSIETEVIVQGQLNMVYSGRSLLSTYFEKNGKPEDTDLSNLALEEESRHGVYYPFSELNGETTIHETKDLCMISHLKELVSCGVASLRITGFRRNQEALAKTTEAYRMALDAVISGNNDEKILEKACDLLNKACKNVKNTGFYL